MLDTDFLFEKYKEKIHCVKKRKKPLTTLKEMVDVNEIPISKIYKDHLEMLKTNVVNSIYVRKEKTIEFHLFYVEDNLKSKIYCQSYAKNPITLPRLKKGTIYIIFEASLGIMETNCSLLAIDFRIQQGIEQEHLDNRDIYFLDYVSNFENRHLFESYRRP
ncbi:hypothetical protein [Enterococcus faecium]|uniref:hypothetical protein n=1 Tax=Enterococcus faecium TaxID=1352 RepID=UPI000DF93ADB|nr:hypothetical protein [Enterococcus faecium]RBT16664.1 hypothetical protein EA95_01158 [Enterococcus faecium]RBT28571.1 hypothetical protein EA72_00584 [Enterococcus faecium]RBT31784.1 hypothetical protein EB01_01716 [Enterococcus faecium]